MNMKKIFSTEYPDEMERQVTEWLHLVLVNPGGSLEVYRPTVIVEIFDQNGQSL